MEQERDLIERIKKRFLEDTGSHEMTIIKDDKAHRHIRFGVPGSSAYYFDLVTYPNFLVYSGDMGTYVFSRLYDMFDFFRTKGDDLSINAGYWTQKLCGEDSRSRCGTKVWSEELHTQYVKDTFNDWKTNLIENDGYEDSNFRNIWSYIKDELVHADDYHEATMALNSFDWDIDGMNPFEDWFESYQHATHEWSHSIIWCLFAINWGIKQYDKHHADTQARLDEQRAAKLREQEEHDNLYQMYHTDVEGAPFKIGQKVKSGDDEGVVEALDYAGGCGETYPDDPMIVVNGINDGFEDGARGVFWKEELIAVGEDHE